MQQLGVSDLKQSLHVRRSWCIIVEAGTTLADIQRPGFWAHVARNLTVRDQFEIWADDGTWYCEAIVRYVGNLEAIVAIKPGSLTEFGNAADAASTLRDYRIRWIGMKLRYGVFRIKDGIDPATNKPAKFEDGPAIKDGFGTKEMAEGWLKDYQKATAA